MVFTNVDHRRINFIGKIVAHCVRMSIDYVVTSRSISTRNCRKTMRSLQDIDVIEKTPEAKETMPNPQIL
jgi:hypothetical protein